MFGLATNGFILFFTNGPVTMALRMRPIGPIQRPSPPADITRIPPGFSALLQADRDGLPTRSKTTS